MMTKLTAGRLCSVAGAALAALALYVVLALPGVLADRDSTVPAHTREARQ